MSKESEQKIDNVFVYEDQELKKLQKQYYLLFMRKKSFQREEY